MDRGQVGRDVHGCLTHEAHWRLLPRPGAPVVHQNGRIQNRSPQKASLRKDCLNELACTR